MCGTPRIKLPILMTKNIDLCHQYGISVAEAQIFLLVKHNWQRRIRGVSCFHKLNQQKAAILIFMFFSFVSVLFMCNYVKITQR